MALKKVCLCLCMRCIVCDIQVSFKIGITATRDEVMNIAVLVSHCWSCKSVADLDVVHPVLFGGAPDPVGYPVVFL